MATEAGKVADVKQRYVVRDASGPGWEWLPDWCVVDTERQVRVAAYDEEGLAREDCAERNEEATNAD
jgi:hypothetical protein